MQIMQHLSSHIHYLTPYQETDRPILVAITGTKSTLLVDAGNSSAHIQFFIDQLVKYDISPRYVVLTHWHWDHVFGMNQANTTIMAQTITTQHIKEMQEWTWDDEALDQRVAEGKEIPFCADAIKKELGDDREILLPTPDITFERRLQINLGRVTCIVEHVGGDHSVDSSVIYVEEDQVLILGDAIYPNIHVTPNEYTADRTLKLVQSLRQFDAETVLLSHHSEPWDRERFLHELNLLEQVAGFVKKENSDEASIRNDLEAYFGRELSEYEIEVIELFINGRNRQTTYM